MGSMCNALSHKRAMCWPEYDSVDNGDKDESDIIVRISIRNIIGTDGFGIVVPIQI